MDFRCLSDFFIRGEPAFRINQVRREERVDQRRLSQTGLTCASQNGPSVRNRTIYNAASPGDVQEDYSPTTMTLNWKPLFKSLCSI